MFVFVFVSLLCRQKLDADLEQSHNYSKDTRSARIRYHDNLALHVSALHPDTPHPASSTREAAIAGLVAVEQIITDISTATHNHSIPYFAGHVNMEHFCKSILGLPLCSSLMTIGLQMMRSLGKMLCLDNLVAVQSADIASVLLNGNRCLFVCFFICLIFHLWEVETRRDSP